MQIADDVEVGQTIENTAHMFYNDESGAVIEKYSTASMKITSSDDDGDDDGDNGDDDGNISTPSV